MQHSIDDKTIDLFLAELVELYHKYGLSLGHEDTQGGFIIELLSETNIQWVKEANREAYNRREGKCS